ncbi:MAG: hypothetical protein IJU95_02815 [Treponema sp.]|nr:hypothetical protein [Treponema sp.]
MKKLIASLLALGTAGLLSAQVTFGVGARGQFGFGLGSSTNAKENFNNAEHDYREDCREDKYKAKGRTYKSYDYESHYDDENLSVKGFESILAGGSIIGRIAFDSVPGLFLQPEIGFSHNLVKYKYSWEGTYTSKYDSKSKTEYEEEGSGSFSYNSIDIPIIAGYDFDIGHGMVISPYGGLNLSIPVGKLSWSWDQSTGTSTDYYDGKMVDYSSYGVSGLTNPQTTKTNSTTLDGNIKNGVIPGIVLGAGFGYKIDKHNMIMGDLRYLLDFVAIKDEVEYKDVCKASAKANGTDFEWDEDDEKWYGGTFRFDALTRRALSIGVNYVYFF